MRQKPGTAKPSAEALMKDIRRRTSKHHSAEEKIRIVLEGRHIRGPERALWRHLSQVQHLTRTVVSVNSLHPRAS